MENIETQYLQLLQRTVQHGVLKKNRTGVSALTLRGGAMLQADLREGLPIITTKTVALRPVKGELIGFLRGYNSAAQFRDLGCNIWNDNANHPGLPGSPNAWLASPHRKGEDDLGLVYGALWRDWPVQRTQPPARLREGLPVTYLGVGSGWGGEHSPLKKTWEGMMARCYDPGNISYPNYGGRGVYVCNRWLEFMAFAADAKNLPGWENKAQNPEPFAYQLDKDARGDGYVYSPDTCSWVSASENSALTRTRTYVVERDGVEFAFTNVTAFCKAHGAEAKNFSDLWTGNKNAQTRSGFRLVRVDEAPAKPQGIDQLAEVIRKLVETPNDRRIIMSAWRPDLFDQMALPPCHVLYQFTVTDGYLDLAMYQRSCDMFLGVPFNMASCGILLCLVAMATGLRPGIFTHFLADVHVYENHVSQVLQQLERTPNRLPYDLALQAYPSPEQLKTPAERLDWLTRINPGNIDIMGYNPHPAIKAPMAV